MGLDPGAALRNNDAAGFFHALGDIVGDRADATNVSDFRAIIRRAELGFERGNECAGTATPR